MLHPDEGRSEGSGVGPGLSCPARETGREGAEKRSFQIRTRTFEELRRIFRIQTAFKNRHVGMRAARGGVGQILARSQNLRPRRGFLVKLSRMTQERKPLRRSGFRLFVRSGAARKCRFQFFHEDAPGNPVGGEVIERHRSKDSVFLRRERSSSEPAFAKREALSRSREEHLRIRSLRENAYLSGFGSFWHQPPASRHRRVKTRHAMAGKHAPDDAGCGIRRFTRANPQHGALREALEISAESLETCVPRD